MQIQLHNSFQSQPQEIDLQKKIRKRNRKLQDHKLRKICSDYQNENLYLWNSDPDRQGKYVYDSGEIDDLNMQYERDAVRRDTQKNYLFKVSSGKPVYWSDFEGKWVDEI
jgi:hypothetical protein